MNVSKVTVTHIPDSLQAYPVLYVPNMILKKLNIPANYPLFLQVADKEQRVICQPQKLKSNQIKMDEQLAKRMGWPEQSQIKLSFQGHSQKLKLGPVLAILVSKYSKSAPPYSHLNSFFEEVSVYARSRHIFVFVTSVENMLRADSNVNGWVFHKNKWHERKCPFPHVVYNRVGTRKLEKSDEFKELKEKITRNNAHMFNSMFLNKWEVYELLHHERKMGPFLPKTQLFGPLALKSLVEQYRTVFIKPIHGSLGRGIYKITKTASGFSSQYTTQRGQTIKNFERLSQLYSYLSKRVNQRLYIIQQGIPLTHYQDRTIDFRALMQKNSKGKWSITSMVARVGPVNRFVSNVARGGQICRVLKALKRCGFKKPKKIRNQLVLVAKKTCELIEETHKDQFGELGVDLGVSRSGQIYLLEINSKPSKTEDTLPSQSKGRPSVRRLLDYTQYLTNQLGK